MRGSAVIRVLRACIPGLFAVACTGDRTPVAPNAVRPRLDIEPAVTLTGRVLGPDGSSICNFAAGVSLVFDLGSSGWSQVIRPCPFETYEAALSPGSHVVHVFPWSPSAPLPRNNYESLTVDPAQPTHDFIVNAGTVLRGRATVDGIPVGGARINYATNPWFSFAVESSPAEGRWTVAGGPVYVQTGLPYYFGPCLALGTYVIPTSAPVVPAQEYGYDCAMQTSQAAGFSHTATPLWLTVGPADLGYSDWFGAGEAAYGLGWGLQYPVVPGVAPSRSVYTVLRAGGLVIGLPSGNLLAPTSVFSVIGRTANDVLLPAAGDLAINSLAAGAKEIFWRYGDQGLAGAPGLSVSQKSWDGSGGSYVLIQYRIRNRTESPIEIAPGLYLSLSPRGWLGNTGTVAMDGRLIYEHMQDRYYGVLLLTAPAPPIARFLPFGNPSSAEISAALKGDGGSTSFTDGGDNLLVSAGVVTLRPVHKVDLAVAVLGGMSETELLANAAAADAEYATK